MKEEKDGEDAERNRKVIGAIYIRKNHVVHFTRSCFAPCGTFYVMLGVLPPRFIVK